MTSLGMRRCRPLISPLVAGTKPVHPLDAGPGVHDEDMASRARAPRGWPPGAGRIGARPRNAVRGGPLRGYSGPLRGTGMAYPSKAFL